ncbi:hypothetical protein [Atopomonas sediminilitoris]|uniref:hypothetical protein n=1 Tax=Atopomonas sediminilitoris TaxID=2919919 RepID=UPI001F4DEB52|nr:hypothetical protein [Atopomonas sediminilitoris]MCJ8170434.1 hypothetical protein [Atopomonas sediminilitoris]
MADGEVVAYRIDERYPFSEFAGDVPTFKRAPFSTGFVLVRHRLQAPALNKPGAATPPAITLYSLYMHLQDWQGYTAKPDLPKPAFWGAGLYKVNCQTDVVQGLRARKGNNRTYPVQCVLPRGTVVEVDPNERSGGWRKVVSCTPAADQAVGCWVDSGKMDYLGGDRYRIGKSAKDPFSADIKGLHVREGKDGGAILGVLPDGALVKAQGEPSDKYWKLTELVSGTATPAIAAGQGYVWRKSLEGDNKPKAFDSVVVLDTPYPIKTGELIGHLGLYQNHDEVAASPLLHVELFTTDDMPAFVAKSRAWASQLPVSEQTLLKVHKGSRLIGHQAAFSADNPPKHSDSGAEVGCDLLIPQSYLDGLPASHKITSKPADKNSQPQRYWRIDNLLCDKEQQPISGWVIEQDPLTTRHSPWEWQGYDFIENREPPKGALAYYLNALRRLTDDEKAQYQALIDQSDKGPVKQRLYDVIDTNLDGHLTSDEIRTALSKPWQAQSLGQLITQHESEWLWNQTKWDELDALMEHTPADPNAVWVEEKKRIQKLRWWSELAEQSGIAADGVVWHFQSTGLIFNFRKSDDENDLKWLKVPKGQLTFDVEGNDIDGSIYFSRIVHWPPVGASGVTIGRGYDVGHQPNVKANLESVGISEPLLSWLDNGAGLKRNNARDYLAGASEKIRQFQITRKQQHDLFLFVYGFMEEDVKRICAKRDVVESFGSTDWEKLNPKIKDMLIDLRYRGDYTPSIRAEIQIHVANNDLASFSAAIKKRSIWPENLPNDRFAKRLEFLEK